MEWYSRRGVLKSSAVLSSLLTGCGEVTTEPRSEPDSADSLTQYLQSSMRAEATIIKTSSLEEPPQVEFSISNNGEIPIRISSESLPPFQLIPVLTGPGNIVSLPEDTQYVSARVSERPIRGCWRLRNSQEESIERVVSPVIATVEISPEEEYTVPHRLYYKNDLDECFLPGTYGPETTIRYYWSNSSISPDE